MFVTNDMELIYSDKIIESYSDNIIRGKGVVELLLKINQPLIIYNLDDTEYEVFKLLSDDYVMMYNTETVVARIFVPNHDFLRIIFDCNEFNQEDEYVFIYFNEELKKIKNKDYELMYDDWNDFVKNGYVSLLPNNPLYVQKENQYIKDDDSLNEVYTVEKMDNEILWLRSTSTGCCSSNRDLYGYVKWRDRNNLLISLNVAD
jgi:hypothetical protein